MNVATIKHNASFDAGRVTANFPRPLYQVVEAFRREYAWVIDFEDPPYFSTFDLVDDTDPAWRASHPDSKGVTRVAGGFFQSTFSESPGHTDKEEVLQKIISDYNSSGNPGKFALRKEGEDRFALVGVGRRDAKEEDESVPVFLDTPITVALEERPAHQALQLVLDTLSKKAGVKILLGGGPYSSDPFQDVKLEVGGNDVPARTLLLQILATGNSSKFLQWTMTYSSDEQAYYFRIEPGF